MKSSAAILPRCWSAALVVFSVIFSCTELGSGAPAPGIVCPSNLAETLKAALQSCQKESKALEGDENEGVTIGGAPAQPEKPAGALSRNSAEQLLHRVRRFDRGLTVFATVTQPAEQDTDDEDDPAPPPASSGPPSKATTPKFGRARRAVTEAEERRRRHAAEEKTGGGITLPPAIQKLGSEKQGSEEQGRLRRASGIVAVAGKHHRKDDDCDQDYGYRRRRQAEPQKNGELMSCAANKLVSEQPFLQKAIEACKDVDIGSALEEDSDQMTAFTECFKSNLKELCPDMPIVE